MPSMLSRHRRQEISPEASDRLSVVQRSPFERLKQGMRLGVQGILAGVSIASAAERNFTPPPRPTTPVAVQPIQARPYRVPTVTILDYVEDPHKVLAINSAQLSTVTNTEQCVEGKIPLPTGGHIHMSSWRGPLDHMPTFIAGSQGIVSDGNVTVLDTTASTARVQQVAFRVTSEKEGESIPVCVLRGKTVLLETNVLSGQIFRHINEDGITAVALQHSLKPMSDHYHRYLEYRESPNGRGDAQYAWWHWSESVRNIEDFDIDGIMVWNFAVRRVNEADRVRIYDIVIQEVRQGQRSHRLIVSDIGLHALTSHPQPTVPAATPSTVGMLALAAAPRWGVPADFEKVLRVLGENVQLSSYGNCPGDDQFRVIYRGGGGSTYRRFQARGIFGGFSIKRVEYVGAGHVADVPPPYCTLSNGDAILAPGTPEYLIFTLEKQGGSLEYEVRMTHSGNSIEEIELYPGLRLELKIQGMYHGRAPEDAKFSFLEDRSTGIDAIAGREMYALVRIDNHGGGEGRCIVRAYIGYTGTMRDQFIGSKELQITSMGIAGTIFNFTVPGGGSGGLSMLTFTAELPDGTRIDYPRTLNQAWYGTDASARGSGGGKKDETTQRRIDRAQGLATGAIQLGNDLRLRSWYGSGNSGNTVSQTSPPMPPPTTNQVQVVQEPPLQASLAAVLYQLSLVGNLTPFTSSQFALEYALRGFLETNEILVRARLRQLFEDYDLTGDPDVFFERLQRDAYLLAYGDPALTGVGTDAQIAGIVFQEMWEASTEHAPVAGSALSQADSWLSQNMTPDLPFAVDTSTLLGRSIAGLLLDIRTASDVTLRSRIAILSSITGIEKGEMEFFLHITRASQDGLLRIQQFFVQKGFGAIFQSSGVSGPGASIRSFTLPKTSFTSQQDSTLHASFDIDPTLKGFHHAHLYLIDADTGQQIDAQTPLTGEIRDRLFADISMETIMAQLKSKGLSSSVFNFKLKLVIWPTESASAISKESSRASIELDWGTRIDPRILMDALTWQSLSEDRRRALREDLDFGDLSRLPVGNKAILEKLINEQLKTGALKYEQLGSGARDYEFEGPKGGTGDKQCKKWLQEDVIPPATGVSIPINASEQLASEWKMEPANAAGEILSADGKVKQVLRITDPTSIRSALQSSSAAGGIKQGDIIQMVYGSVQHTMVIGKITNEGLWVFDTNWEFKRFITVNPGLGTYYKNNNGELIEAKTDEEKAIADLNKVDDNTVRFHFLGFDSLQRRISEMTVYRISQ